MAAPLVLCYHGVSEEWSQSLAVRPRAFERQLESIVRRGYRPVDAATAIGGSGRLVHVTFDDAYRNVASALPTLERLGAPATIFAAAAFADEPGRPLDVPELAAEAAAHPQHLATMGWDELREVQERGFEIGSHTVSHPHLPRLSDAELDRELADSRARCEAELGRPCRYLAYPYGEHDERVESAARRAGYDAAFSLHAGHWRNRFAVPRVDFYRRDSLPRATLKTSPLRRPAYALAARLRRSAAGGEASFHGEGWLAAALPAGAHRLRVTDPGLAARLAEAGAELVERNADVEIGPAGALQGTALHAVVPIDGPPHDSASRALRIARRVGNSAAVRVRAARASRAAPRAGYPHADVVLWDNAQAWRGPGMPAGPRSVVERFPQHALVIGRRGPRRPTLLDAVLAEAGRAAGIEFAGAPVSVRNGGVLLAVSGDAVLRAAVGPGGRQIGAQAQALALLHAAGVDPLVAERVSHPLATGRTGLADWSVESRLPGVPAERLSEPLLDDAVDFLVALHRAGTGEPAAGPRAAAAAVAAHVPAATAVLEDVGARLEEALAAVPVGFGHGDFFLGNLLVDGGRLSGVFDWDAGGPARAPLIDLLHLRHMAEHDVPDDDWGRSLVEHLLPWARAGGDAVARRYCERVGADPRPATLEALVLAYWLDRVAYQLRTHAHRLSQRRWLERNIDDVLASLAER
jgi:peptidoglycan/xylan/chitin deacetylase (PgdA/CDA1 family)